MATRGRTTYLKRQKEMARKERQQMKAARRENRRATRSIEDDKMPQQDPTETVAEQAEQSANDRQLRRGHSNL